MAPVGLGRNASYMSTILRLEFSEILNILRNAGEGEVALFSAKRWDCRSRYKTKNRVSNPLS